MPTKKRSGTPSAASSSSKQPEPLTVFLDESLDSDAISNTLSATGVTVERLTRHLPRGTPDADWLFYAGERGWVVLTRDKRVRYRRLERLALRAANVRTFVFIGGNVTLDATAAILARAVPYIRAICAREPGPSIYHIGVTGKPRRMD